MSADQEYSLTQGFKDAAVGAVSGLGGGALSSVKSTATTLGAKYLGTSTAAKAITATGLSMAEGAVFGAADSNLSV